MAGEAKRYEVEYSRFFHYPNTHSPPSVLQAICKSRKLRTRGGMWLSPSSASLRLLIDDDDDSEPPVLVISLRGTICEEHYISKLSFSWPQMSCVSDCPTRGCRVVFARYKDGFGQIQKFAMRFSSSSACQLFMDTVKECLRRTGVTQFLSRSEDPLETQNFTSNELLYSGDPGLSLVNEVENFAVTTLPTVLQGTYEALPPTFTSHISECFAEDERELAQAQEMSRAEYLGADMPPETMKPKTTASFCDLLGKLERVITEMGGDLALC